MAAKGVATKRVDAAFAKIAKAKESDAFVTVTGDYRKWNWQAKHLGATFAPEFMRWIVLVGLGEEAADPDRMKACLEVFDRCGLPRRTESEVTGKGLSIHVEGMESALGWPAAPADSHDGDAAERE